MSRGTILRPPPDDPNRAPIENVLEITELPDLGPDIFTNTRPPWHPPGARGIFGGLAIAQSLAAAHRTVPAGFYVHSCHSYFLRAGSASSPILYHVERLRDGRSFSARTVQARQRGLVIFTITLSFARDGGGSIAGAGDRGLRHAQQAPLERLRDVPREPAGIRENVPGKKGKDEKKKEGPEGRTDEAQDGEDEFDPDDFKSPNTSTQVRLTQNPSIPARRVYQWIRARGTISRYEGHVEALAYMSDSFFLWTVARVHGAWRLLDIKPEQVPLLPAPTREHINKVIGREEGAPKAEDVEYWKTRPRIGMNVSVDHSIYFHEARSIKADEWLFTEVWSPWAGHGRGFVVQHIYARDGTLLATCTQEGVVRLAQDGPEPEGAEVTRDEESEDTKAKL